MDKQRTAIATLLVFGCVGIFGAANLFMGYSPLQTLTCFLAPSPMELTQLGQPIADGIERFKTEHGAYPASLVNINFDDESTFFGEWRYTVSDDRQMCTLANGDYSRYLFEVWWTPLAAIPGEAGNR